MKYKVGDFVWMPQDKYEKEAYGIIMLCNEARESYRVAWLDAHHETTETDSSILLVGESPND